MTQLHVILIDNFDSFTFNLVDEFKKQGAIVSIYRNDVPLDFILDHIKSIIQPKLLVLSPGPGTPETAGICIDLIQAVIRQIPILGVCLGHQALAVAMGGCVSRTEHPSHGKSTYIHHDGSDLFENLPNPLRVGRYHSLAISTLPNDFIVTAASQRVPMAIRHIEYPVYGVQFHPESILTPMGSHLIHNLVQSLQKEPHHVIRSVA